MNDEQITQYIEDCLDHLAMEHPSVFEKCRAVNATMDDDQQWSRLIYMLMQVHDRTCDVKLVEDLD